MPVFPVLLLPEPHGPGSMDKLTDFSRRVRVDIVASAAEVEPLLAIILDVCHTRREGDGVVWVTQVSCFHRLWLPL